MDIIWLNNFIRSIDWTILSNIAVVVSAYFVIRQLVEMRHTTHAQGYTTAIDILQEEEIRQARKNIFQFNEKPIDDWTKEEIETAEKVCYTYDVVGQMVRYHLLPKNIIIDSWGPSIRNSWPILSQLIHKYRIEFNAPEYWDDFEWLVIESEKFQKRQQIKSKIKSYFETRWK